MAQMELTGKKRGKSREMAIKYIFADVDGTLGIGGIGNMLKRAEASVYAQDVHRTV